MKRILTALFFVSTVLQVKAQKQFEGTIVYAIRENGSDSSKQRSIEVIFGKPGIRASYTENGKVDNEVLLYRFDSSALYSLHSGSMEYTSSPLYPPFPAVPGQSTIAGFKTTAVMLNPKAEYSPLGPSGAMNLHLADDLYYKLPDNIGTNSALFFLRNGRIVLGIEAYKTRDAGSMATGREREVPVIDFIATAVLVKPSAIEPSLLEIPAGYKSTDLLGMSGDDIGGMDSTMVTEEVSDSVMMATDSTYTGSLITSDTLPTAESMDPPAPKPVKRKPAAPRKPKTKPVTPARKPD